MVFLPMASFLNACTDLSVRVVALNHGDFWTLNSAGDQIYLDFTLCNSRDQLSPRKFATLDAAFKAVRKEVPQSSGLRLNFEATS